MKYEHSLTKISSLLFLISLFFILTSGRHIETRDHKVNPCIAEANDKRDFCPSNKDAAFPDSLSKSKSASLTKEIYRSKITSERINNRKTSTVIRPKGKRIPKGTGKPKGSAKPISGKE